MRVGGQGKCTAEARGKANPEWEEVLEFALSGNVVDSPDAHIEVALLSSSQSVGVTRHATCGSSWAGFQTCQQCSAGCVGLGLALLVRRDACGLQYMLQYSTAREASGPTLALLPPSMLAPWLWTLWAHQCTEHVGHGGKCQCTYLLTRM